jgi:hypothetical protein
VALHIPEPILWITGTLLVVWLAPAFYRFLGGFIYMWAFTGFSLLYLWECLRDSLMFWRKHD